MYYDKAISVTNISKIYKMYSNPKDRLKQFLFKNKSYYREFSALSNISFNISKGKTVGIIGKNGSGKSTLLQLITGTLLPSSGEVSINGRVAALLELGSGFNPEFTGRENVYLNGSILGLSKKEMDEKISTIEEFAEIGEFIDQPVKLYSSGMYVRLAFACAINVDPDILIVDEALAVGDMQFQLKCMDKMKRFKESGKTILFVSHDTYSVKNFCDEAIWLKDGSIYRRGDVLSVTNEYEDFMKSKEIKEEISTKEEVNNNAHLTIDSIIVKNVQGDPVQNVYYGEKMNIEVGYTIHKEIDDIIGGLAIIDQRDTYICGLNTKLDNFPISSDLGHHKLICNYENLTLLPGTYYIDAGFFETSGLARYDYKTKGASFYVQSDKYMAEGISYLPHTWEVR
ncbi:MULTISPECIES: ABC transporter ATP-binding protein [unclassified Paenibacillus]|uniref:ABC transporter ATP-binding protein n=1 Tax=unclassified Paenibacillus TaxID=185978 RepID=UPI00041F51C2|nr:MULTISPECIES: ABC transporter ATP-binding protein [unclassified Paenibacillus]KGP80829.1 ABC transporter [Paenibacillus sp. MAEPY2]KGP88069.1 ABC transporter [Paenibacillus sp. MAEPY1]